MFVYGMDGNGAWKTHAESQVHRKIDRVWSTYAMGGRVERSRGQREQPPPVHRHRVQPPHGVNTHHFVVVASPRLVKVQSHKSRANPHAAGEDGLVFIEERGVGLEEIIGAVGSLSTGLQLDGN